MPHKTTDFKPLRSDIVEIPVDRLDSRSDEEIVAEILSYKPVKHEKNLWSFWDKGYSAMHPWLRRNVIGWVRRLSSNGWDVRIVDMVEGSPNHYLRYIDQGELPETLVKGTMDGHSIPQHSSDMIRLPLLLFHGGVWIDVSSIIFRDFDDVWWKDIMDPQSPIEFGAAEFACRTPNRGQFVNGFLACRKGNAFMARWHELFKHIWKDRTRPQDLSYHPLLGHFEPFNSIQASELGMGDFSSPEDTHFISDYLAQILCAERVRLLVDPSTGWDGPAYFRKSFSCVSVVQEVWLSSKLVANERQAPLLALPFQPDRIHEDSEQLEVFQWVNDVIASTTIAKFSSGYWIPGMPVPLAMTWQKEPNFDADISPGTWAEYLRYASTHFEQTRNAGRSLERITFEEEKELVQVGGLLEPPPPGFGVTPVILPNSAAIP